MLCTCVESCGKSPGSLPVGPRSHECDKVNRQKLILLLKFACNTDLEPKKIGCLINK